MLNGNTGAAFTDSQQQLHVDRGSVLHGPPSCFTVGVMMIHSTLDDG